MATYLSGSPTFLPTVQPYQPNLQLYAGALQMKQTQYDTNRKKISDLYGSLLNSPMTRDSNIAARDEFFKSIDYEIKKLSSVDLSLQENVDQAANLFTSLYDNKNIVKDMMWTKNYQNEMDRADGFKNCVDPEKCGGQYWEGGVNALQFRREEFRNLSDDQAMGFNDVSYTPYVDVMGKATKIAKDSGLNMKVDQVSGDWIVTTKNGKQLEGPLLALFQKQLGQDPTIAQYYRTKAYVDRKSYAMNNAEQFGSAEAAEQNYITESTKKINEIFSRIQQDAEYARDNSTQKAEELKKNIEEGNVDADAEAQAEYEALFGQADNNDYTSNEVSGAMSTANNSMSIQNLMLQGEAVDGSMAMLALNDDLQGAAQILAYRDYESTLKENPYAMEDYRQENRIALEDYKAKLKKQEAEEEMKGSEINNTWFQSGVTWIDEVMAKDPLGGYKQIKEDINLDKSKVKSNQQQILERTLQTARDSRSAQANNDAVAIVDATLKQLQKDAQASGDKDKLEYANGLLREWKGKDAKSQLGWARNFDMNQVTKNMSADGLQSVYRGTVEQMYDFDNNKTTKLHRTYLKNLAAQPEMQSMVTDANQAYANMQDWRNIMRETNKTVIQHLKENGDPKYNSFYDNLLDDDGLSIKTEDEFSWDVANKRYSLEGLSDAQIRERYRKRDERERFETSYVREQVQAATNFTDKWNNMSDKEKAGKSYDKERQKYLDKQLADSYRKQYDRKGQSNVIVVNSKGERQKIPVSEFFTENGNVKAKYNNFADRWKAAEDNSFWDAYYRGKSVYSGRDFNDVKRDDDAMISSRSYSRNTSDVGNLSQEEMQLAEEAFRSGKTEKERKEIIKQYRINNPRQSGTEYQSDFVTEYKRAFNTAPIYKGGKKYEGLTGVGSEASKGLSAFIDYGAPMSKTVLDERSFLENAFNTDRNEGVLFSFGKAKGSLPSMSDAKAEAFVKKMVGDAIMGKKDSRPTWISDFNPIGGGKKGWQAYSMTINDPTWLKKYAGTDETPGIFYSSLKPQGENANSGTVTIYLKDTYANNNLHNQTKVSSLERRLGYAGSAPVAFNRYNNISNLQYVKNPNGPGFSVQGSVQVGYNDDGTKMWSPVNETYHTEDMDVNLTDMRYDDILAQINARLQPVRVSMNNRK